MKNLCKYLVFSAVLHFFLLFGNLNSSIAQSWLYLGQPPPGMIPERFAPDYLCANQEWNWHSTAVFSPDGTEMFFVKYYNSTVRLELATMRYENNTWIGPEIAKRPCALNSATPGCSGS